MARRLQNLKHSETAYQRPDRDWSCGRECEGYSCALGPDTRGSCRADFITEGACRPFKNSDGSLSCDRKDELGGPCRMGPREDGSCSLARKAGQCIPAKGQYNKITRDTTNPDRWFCTRDSSRGGTCEDGPLPDGSCCLQVAPCRPKSSLRRIRGTFTVLLAGYTIAAVILLFSRNPETLSHPLNPGPVSTVHSTADITCAKCHTEPAVNFASLAKVHRNDPFADGKLCLDCHAEIGHPSEPRVFFPHTMPQFHLEKLTAKAKKKTDDDNGGRPLFVALASAVAEEHSEIACSSCHREHGGRHVDLRHLSNDQCQVCHTGQFHGFADGHPDFTAYPYRRRTRIFFDHETHFRQYFKSEEVIEGTDEFADKPAARSCADCHEPDPQGGMMLTRSFEETCAACHDSNTRDGAWEVFTFPRMRLSRLADQLDEAQREKLDAWNSSGKANEVSPLLRMWLDDMAEDAESPAPESLYVSKDDNAATKERAAKAALRIHDEFFGADEETIRNWLLASGWLEDASDETRRRLGKDLATVFVDLRKQAQASGNDENPPPLVSTSKFGGTFSFEAESGSLTYTPGGHADPILKAALDNAASKAQRNELAKRLLADASGYELGFDTNGAGRCIKCHTLDEHPNGSMTINWHPASDDVAARPITKFNHRTHFDLPEILEDAVRKRMGYNTAYDNNSCAACHTFKRFPEGDVGKAAFDDHLKGYRNTFSEENRNPFRFRSGFEELDHASCVECHTTDKAGDSCLLCHRYHATPLPMAPPVPDGKPTIPSTDDDSPLDEGSQQENPGENQTMPDPGPGDGGGLLPGGDDKQDGGGLLPGGEDNKDGSGLLPGGDDNKDGGGLLPGGDDKKDGGGLLPGGEDNKDGGGLLPGGEDNKDGGGLLPGGDDSMEDDDLLPGGDDNKDGGGLLPGGDDNKDGGGLLPGRDDSMEGDDLLPGGEDKKDGGGLLPGGDNKKDTESDSGLLPGGNDSDDLLPSDEE